MATKAAARSQAPQPANQDFIALQGGFSASKPPCRCLAISTSQAPRRITCAQPTRAILANIAVRIRQDLERVLMVVEMAR
jgi:hypothetical protein